MRTPSPWWILAPIPILISSCIFSMIWSIYPPIPPHSFFDKAEILESEKKIILHINEEWLQWIFTVNPYDYVIWGGTLFERCQGTIKITNGNFSRKISMSLEINEEKIMISFDGMKLTCNLERNGEYIDLVLNIITGSTSIYNSDDISSESKIRIKLTEIDGTATTRTGLDIAFRSTKPSYHSGNKS